MSIDFATVESLEIPEGKVVQIADTNGVVLWSAVKKAKVTVKTSFGGMSGDTASITVNSSKPFAPNPSNPNYTTTSWTVSVVDEPDCTIEIPTGSTIECTVSRDKGNADSYISLNGTRMVTGEGTYLYTVTGDVTITIADKYSQGDYGIITIIEA
jgi:hypothetical protein